MGWVGLSWVGLGWVRLWVGVGSVVGWVVVGVGRVVGYPGDWQTLASKCRLVT